jgi:hypothetical protein
MKISINGGFLVGIYSFIDLTVDILFCSLEKLIIAVKIKEPEAPILSSTYDIELDTLLSNTYTVIVRGKQSIQSIISTSF